MWELGRPLFYSGGWGNFVQYSQRSCPERERNPSTTELRAEAAANVAAFSLTRGVEVKRVGYQIKVNKKWCKACGICIEFCPKSVLAFGEDGKVEAVKPDDCIGCRLCELRCPDFAIEVGGEGNE